MHLPTLVNSIIGSIAMNTLSRIILITIKNSALADNHDHKKAYNHSIEKYPLDQLRKSSTTLKKGSKVVEDIEA